MTDCRFGDIVLVPFPFTDQTITKKRPAVIVSSDAYNRQRRDIILMAVTSQMGSADFFGDMTINQWQDAGLLKPSVTKPVFTTVEKNLVLKKLGRMSKQDRSALQEALQTILGE
ncbi:MAG: type II toxin-antitoxin system PemK/MazF family toxin [Thermodesulfobacteriota bacterium]|nr:type II toxin-antitoxin system PemK/MazF family toxin [Thermodesulfobacteriota bacterium]